MTSLPKPDAAHTNDLATAELPFLKVTWKPVLLILASSWKSPDCWLVGVTTTVGVCLNAFVKETEYCCEPVVTGVEIDSVLPCNSNLAPNLVTAIFWLVSLLVNIALN